MATRVEGRVSLKFIGETDAAAAAQALYRAFDEWRPGGFEVVSLDIFQVEYEEQDQEKRCDDPWARYSDGSPAHSAKLFEPPF